MSKMKLHYTLSKNEFILLTMLVFIAAITLSVTYLIMPRFEEFTGSLEQYGMQKLALENLKAEYANLSKYQEQDADMENQLAELQKEIPAYFSEEEVIALLDQISESSGLVLSSLSFGGITTETESNFLASIKLSSSGAASVSGGSSSGQGNGESYVSSERITVSFEGEYDDLYQFLTDLESEARQVYVRNAVLSRSEDGRVNGSLILLFVSSIGSGDQGSGEYPGYEYDTPEMTGKTNPFVSFEGYDGYSSESSSSVLVPDFYAILNSYDDNASKVLFGKYPVSAEQATANENAVSSASLSLSKADGVISYQYTLEGTSYSGSFTPETDAETITMSILSRSRRNSQDNVGLLLDVENSTGLELVIQVQNDDTVNPRFVLGSTTGGVRVVK